MKEAAIRMKMDMTPVDSLVPVDMVAGVGRCGCERVCVGRCGEWDDGSRMRGEGCFRRRGSSRSLGVWL